jgi:hypothetical protein
MATAVVSRPAADRERAVDRARPAVLYSAPMNRSPLASLVAVAELDLSSNRLESLTGIGGMTGLVSLTLDGNCLCELPEEAGRLLKLRQISLKNNRFSKKAFSHDGQSIPASFFVQTLVDTIDLGGNPGLTKALVLDFDGVQSFVERRKKAKDKSLQGGALTDFNLFGLD